jgi:hypothetical protein
MLFDDGAVGVRKVVGGIMLIAGYPLNNNIE